MSTTVHLIRHGEVYNPDKILYGRMDGFRLSDRGQAQAATTAAALKDAGRDVVAVTASPLLRAQQTASAIGEAFNLPVASDDRLIEAGNTFEGTTVGARPLQLLNPRWWPLLRNPLRPSWGEPYLDQAQRVLAVVADVARANVGHESVLVSHQLPIWVARLHIEGKRLWHDPRKRQCTLCSVTSLTFDDDALAAGSLPVAGLAAALEGIDYSEPAAALSATLSTDGWSVK
ncbi:MAG: histidine phosphatase family protein [Cellulomonadaceae bacterium]|jgi:broad specificity phosphatase PhoE|nr:histidine phosphatase family protein [Cellulomonadaceae bacterium]